MGFHEEEERHLKAMLAVDVIQPSSSPWISALVLVRKKDVCGFQEVESSYAKRFLSNSQDLGLSGFSWINLDYITVLWHINTKSHTVPKEVSPLDDDGGITESARRKMLWFYRLRTALCESIRYQAKSEQNI